MKAPSKEKFTKEQKVAAFFVALFFIAFIVILIVSGASENNSTSFNENSTSASETAVSGKSTVAILATGGTIAGSGEEGKETGYKSGALSAESLIASVPKIKDVANIKAEQLFNLNSDDITQNEWLVLARKINELEKDNSVDGIVITHGTDTMEETAYFLNLVCNVTKPVIITGSMRPATATSADGPLNLYQAVLVASNNQSKNKPVMCVMNDMILEARAFYKTSTSAVDTMQSGDIGALGLIRDDKVYYFDDGVKMRHTTNSEFRIDSINSLPKVSIVYFYVDADVNILKSALDSSDGVVVAGAGAGEYSES